MRISKQLNIPWKGHFKRNKNIKKKIFRKFSEKHCVLTLMTSSAKNIYCPAGLCDTEDVNRELPFGLWRNDNCADSMFSLEKPTRGHNPSIAAKEI